MATSLHEVLDRAFGHPRGLLGRVGGAMMERGNGPTESKVVEVAKPASDETVLVIGPGPGVGLDLAAARAHRAIGVDPSEEMLRRCRRRCAAAVEAGTVALRAGTAEATGQEADSVDVVLSVNNLMQWSDRPAALAEMLRVMRPGGRLVVSAHEKWLAVSRHELVREFETAGFADVQSWTWDPPGRAASRAVQLRAVRPRS